MQSVWVWVVKLLCLAEVFRACQVLRFARYHHRTRSTYRRPRKNLRCRTKCFYLSRLRSVLGVLRSQGRYGLRTIDVCFFWVRRPPIAPEFLRRRCCGKPRAC
jgi:hypothetical protein